MKFKLYFFVALIAITTSCKKSNDNISLPIVEVKQVAASAVPSTVVSTFNTSYAGATQVEWFWVSTSSNSTNSVEYEVEYNHASQRHNSRFDNNGVEKHHSITCIEAPVPQIVLTAFRNTHTNDLVYEWKLRNDGTWKAHYLRGAVKWEATYSAAGVLIKEEQA